MESVRILKAIEGFIQLIEQEGFPDEAQLESALDELALASNFCIDFEFDERELPDAPDLDQIKIRDMVYSKFPDYGMYNLPEKVADDLSETELMLGSAHDDLQDIYRDLKEVKWAWENNSAEDGLWQFHWGYDHHWGAHLRNLQWYLYNSRYEGVCPINLFLPGR